MTCSCSKSLSADSPFDGSLRTFSGSLATLRASVLRRRADDTLTRILEPGALIGGRYRILREIGQGSYGRVYEAADRLLGSASVALKLFEGLDTGNGDRSSNFGREVVAMSRIAHQNVVRLYEVVRSDGYIGFSMELVRGVPLNRLIGAGLRLTPREVGYILRQLGHGLAEMHRRNIIHRDLKPANIVVTDAGQIKIIDLGCAHLLGYPQNIFSGDKKFFQRRAIIGTPHYMAPEVIAGDEATAQADVYALAMIGYVLLTGRYPFTTKNFSRFVRQKCFKDPPSVCHYNQQCPEDLARIIQRGIARRAEGRFRAVADFTAALDECDWINEALEVGEEVPGLLMGARVRAHFGGPPAAPAPMNVPRLMPLAAGGAAVAGLLAGAAVHRTALWELIRAVFS